MSGEEDGLLPSTFIDRLRAMFNAQDKEGRGTLDREQLLSMIDENAAITGDMVYEQMERDEDGASLSGFLLPFCRVFRLFLYYVH